ncbi:MAG TPA: tetratricopeptide repeat protein [Anaerohalosphaeraceae bacterium]|nr:tetratricopeptide repeat protein [Anaerohalosphaeraceae bacterium]
MARTILRAGRIAGWVIIAGAVLGVVLYWAGVMSMAKTPGPGQSSEVTVDLEAETAAAEAARAAEAAAIADVEQAIREHFDAKRYAELEAYCSGVLVETPYDSAAIRAKDAIVRSYILTGQDAQAAAATAELLNQFGSVPGASRALCNIGDAWRNEGRIAEAQQVYRQAVLCYPGDEFARWSQLHLCMMALERSDVQETVDGVWRLIGDFDDDPGMPLAAIQIGEAFFKAGHRDIALEIYHSMLENYADNEATVWAQKNICTMLIDAGDDAEAAAALDTLITKFKSAPTTPSALMEVGDRYRDAKRYENALQAYQYAAAYDPNSLDARKAVCQTHLKLDDAEAAVEVVWEMIGDLAKDSGMPLAAVQVAEELAKARQPDMALEIYRYLVDNHADNEATVWAQKNICTMLIDAGDDAEAAAALDTLITKFKSVSTTPGALKEIGDRYRAAGKYDRALLAYEHAVAHDPDYLDARKALCLTQLRRNDVEGAAETVWRMMSELAEHEWMPLAAVQMGEEFAKAGRREIAMEINQYMVADHADRNEAAWAQKNICLMLIEAGDEPGAAAAIEVLSTMFATADATPESLLEIGDRYCDLKQFDRALEVYRLAAAGIEKLKVHFESEETVAAALVQIGDKYGWMKNYGRARQLYDAVKATYRDTPSYIWANQRLIGIEIEQDAAGAVITEDLPATIAASIDGFMNEFAAVPQMTGALCRLGEIYYFAGASKWKPEDKNWKKAQFGKASMIFDKVMKDAPFDAVFTADAYYMTADLYSRLGDFGKAVEYHQAVVDNWPEHHLAWSSLYWVGTFTTKLKWDKAIPAEEADAKSEKAFLDLFEKYPGSAMADSAQSQLGMIYFKSNHWEKAAGIYEEIVKGSPSGEKVPKAMYYLAQAYRYMGQKEMAVLAFKAFAADWGDTALGARAAAAAAELGGQQ